jgi:cytochrome c553
LKAPSVAVGLAVAVACTLAVLVPADAQPKPPGFAMACAPCHGFEGIGNDPAIPNLAGQSVIYLYNQMMAFRTGARKHPEMNFFSGQMTQEEMQAIAEYYSKLPK